jgi:hypothetical protein
MRKGGGHESREGEEEGEGRAGGGEGERGVLE